MTWSIVARPVGQTRGMAAVAVTDGHLVVTPTPTERIFGFLGVLSVPVGSVASVAVERDLIAAVPGVRLVGAHWPGRCKLGRWRHRGERWYVVAPRRGPGVVVTLTGSRWARVCVSTPDGETLAHQLDAG